MLSKNQQRRARLQAKKQKEREELAFIEEFKVEAQKDTAVQPVKEAEQKPNTDVVVPKNKILEKGTEMYKLLKT